MPCLSVGLIFITRLLRVFFFFNKIRASLGSLQEPPNFITDINVSLEDHQLKDHHRLKGRGDILLTSKLSWNLLNVNHKAQGCS